jgi:hypothetical protein
MKPLREAIAQCRVWFAEYSASHLAKGTPEAIEKAQRNQRRVEFCDQALQGGLEMPDVNFQLRVKPWMLRCFGLEIASDGIERNHRFLEEALELVQACGCTASEAHQLVDYVFDRPVGESSQEAGGVMVTLAALCLANAIDMHAAGEIELARIWGKIDQIRAKQAAKPKHGPLPGPSAPTPKHTGPRWADEIQGDAA